jgi:hypothetical protein
LPTYATLTVVIDKSDIVTANAKDSAATNTFVVGPVELARYFADFKAYNHVTLYPSPKQSMQRSTGVKSEAFPG